MPFDYVKSRLQADQNSRQYAGFVDCAVKTYRRGGARVFFDGFLINSIRSFPVNGITFLVYTQALKKMNEVGQQPIEAL